MTFSIITVTYNSGPDLAATLDSIHRQSYADYECLIQDGGSDDGSLAAVPADERFHFVSAPDEGIYDAMNRATNRSRGQWLLYLNAGDCFHDDEVLARLANTLDKDASGIVYGDVVGDYGSYRVHHRPAVLSLLWLRKPFHHQAMLISGELARQETYDLDFPIVADHELAARLYQTNTPFTYLNETIARVDMSGGVSKDRYVATSRESFRVFRRHFFGWKRLLLHLAYFLKLVVVKQLPRGVVRRLRKVKNSDR